MADNHSSSITSNFSLVESDWLVFTAKQDGAFLISYFLIELRKISYWKAMMVLCVLQDKV